jgi:superfamily I DNA and/or RNA helicase
LISDRSKIGETNKDRDYWEIAVLTYYRAQERLLKTEIGRYFGRPPRSVFWYDRKGRNPVRIEICTVDRFQGHEADYVILSLVRTRGVGFLDSPNRLNVALTRGRYLVLVIGDRGFFSRKERARALHDLAVDQEMAPPYREYETRKSKEKGSGH